jgi:hypothetical protein
MLFCWWRYDRRSYLNTWCCRCCFVDGDTIVDLTFKLDGTILFISLCTFVYCCLYWVSECCLTLKTKLYSSYIMTRTRYFRWEDNDDIHFVLEQHAYLECYNVTSLKQQSMSVHVGTLYQMSSISSDIVFNVRY